ncbi:hypothetical protein SRHO_G00290650 [Serrasalmus rhombeus]
MPVPTMLHQEECSAQLVEALRSLSGSNLLTLPCIHTYRVYKNPGQHTPSVIIFSGQWQEISLTELEAGGQGQAATELALTR